MNRTQRIAAVDAVYASLPKLDCKGFCHDSCGPIVMTALERQRLRAAGQEIHHNAPANGRPGRVFVCSALTDDNRCAQYSIRPAICRIWGMTRALQCTYGCVPEGGYLPEREGYTFLADVAHAAGEYAEERRLREAAASPYLEQVVAQEQSARLHRYGVSGPEQP